MMDMKIVFLIEPSLELHTGHFKIKQETLAYRYIGKEQEETEHR